MKTLVVILSCNLKKDGCESNRLFFNEINPPAGFVKCTLCVKYASRVKCAAAREGIYFVSHCDEGAIFHNLRSKLFHIRHR